MALAKWIDNIEGFLDEGTILYTPLLRKVSSSGGKYDQMEGRHTFNFPDWIDSLECFSAPHIALSDKNIKINRIEFRPLFHIDLPFIQNVDLKFLKTIIDDNPEKLGAFRDFLLDQLSSTQSIALGSEQFSNECRRIERDIRSELRKLNTAIKTSRIKNITSLVGGTIATWTLALFCIIHDQPDVLKVLGPGGAVWTLSSAYMEYLTGKILRSDNPVYFLWLLGQCKS